MLPQLGFASIPELLRPKTEGHWAQFCERLDGSQKSAFAAAIAAAPIGPIVCVEQLTRCFTSSEFVAQSAMAKPDMFIELIASGDLFRPLGESGYQNFKDAVATACSDAELDVCLRRHRRREMMRIVWRDLVRSANLDADDLYQTTGELSEFADTAVQLALDFHYAQLQNTHGTPIGN